MSNQRIGVKIDPKDRVLIEKICQTRGEQISSFVRRAIKKELASLNYCNSETKKALGLSKGGVT